MSSIAPVNSNAVGTTASSAQISATKSEPISVQESLRESEVESEKPQLSIEETKDVVESLNNAMSLLQRGVAFQVDENTERTIVKIIDRETSETIKQFPSEDLVKLIERMQEMQSLLFDNDPNA